MSLELNLPELEMGRRQPRSLKAYSQVLADQLFGSPWRTISSIGVIAACLLLIAWNVSRLSILTELAQLEIREYQLDDQLSDLEFSLAAIDLERITSEIEAESDRIFQGFPELASWADGLNRRARAEHLVFSYSVEKPHLSPVPNVLEVPLVLTFTRQKSSDTGTFAASTSLIEEILRDHWHIDVLSTQATGTGLGLVVMSVHAQVWVRDRFGFVDIASLDSLANTAPNTEFEN